MMTYLLLYFHILVPDITYFLTFISLNVISFIWKNSQDKGT